MKMERKQDKDEPRLDAEQLSRLVDMTVTEENPITVTRRSQDGVTEVVVSQLQGAASNDVVAERDQSQQLMQQSVEGQAATPLIPVDISGGEFHDAHIGPTTMTATKNVGFEGGDFSGAHIGSTNITVNVHNDQIKPPKRARRKKQKKPDKTRYLEREKGGETTPNGYQLSDSIWIFKGIQLAKKALVFEGEKRSGILKTQRLAIKCIPNYKTQNIREAQNLVKLAPHTNVVSIVHSDVYHGGPVKSMYIAMERCSTTTLKAYIEDRKQKNIPFNLRLALEHSKQVVDAIHHIHENNILHRDLKPSSILFSIDGKHIKIADFGLSKELELGRSTTHLSTLEPGVDGCRAPEIYNRHDSVSKMADIFSLALVLYYLWSYGFHPFGREWTIWIFNIKQGIKRDLSCLRIPLRDVAKGLLERMLNFDPKQRPTIGQIRNEQFMKEDLIASLIKNLKLLWDGAVKGNIGLDMMRCQLYQSPNSEAEVGIDGSDWKLAINTIRRFEVGSLGEVTNETPAGYLVTPAKEELEKLANELAENQLMAWIDISKEGNQSKVLLLVSHKDYPELYGIFLPDAKILSSLVQGIVGDQKPTPLQPKGPLKEMATELAAHSILVSPDKVEPDLVQLKSPEVTPEMDTYEPPQQQQARPQSTTPPKQTVTELIPWWIFSGSAKLQR